MKQKISNYLYYIIIGVVSFVALVFLPMIGSEIPLGFSFPRNDAEWAVFIICRLIVSVINVLIFHSFMRQAKVNIKDDANYKLANEILGRVKDKKYKPRSPVKWNAEQYSIKGVTLFVSSILSTVVLAQAILTYDWMSMLLYIFTIVMAIVFGVLQMKKAEEYWTREYYDYAKLLEESKLEEEKALLEQNKENTTNNTEEEKND